MYIDWEEKSMLVVSKLKWYLVEDVMDYLHEIRSYVINTPAKFSLTYLPQLKDRRLERETEPSDPLLYQIPSSKTTRFPSYEIYLCEAIGEWSLLLDRLHLACNIMVNTNRLDRRYPDFETAGQLELFILQLVNTLLQMLEAKEDFITQQVFEKRYDLNWSDNQQLKEMDTSNNEPPSSKET